jgi:hypothetical protein
MRVIKILGGLLLASSLLACGTRESAPASYAELMGLEPKSAQVTVSSFARSDGVSRRSYVLVPADTSANQSELEFRTYSRYLQKLLDARGYHPAASLAEAELVISLDYRVEGPVERVYVDPYWVRQRSGILGPNYELSPHYTRRVVVRACDAARYRKDGQLDELWSANMMSVGRSNDLRSLMPVILLAAWDLYGVDSRQSSSRSVDINGSGMQWLCSEDGRALQAQR